MQLLADKLFILLVARLRDPRRCPTNPPFSRSSSCGRFHVDSHCAADTKIKFTVRVYLLVLRANQLRQFISNTVDARIDVESEHARQVAVGIVAAKLLLDKDR